MRCAITTFLLFLFSSTACVAETGIWITYQGNAQHTGYLPVQVDPANFHVLWTKKLVENNGRNAWWSTPDAAVTDKMLYVSTYQSLTESVTLSGLNITTGDILWQVTLDHSLGISAPAYANGKVFISHDIPGYPDSTLRAYKADNGKLLFLLPVSHLMMGVFGTPVTNDQTVYVQTASPLHAVDTNTGRPSWVKPVGETLSPAFGGHQIYSLQTGALIVANDKDGTEAYRIAAPDIQAPMLDNSSPVLDEGNQLLFAIGTGKTQTLYAFNLKDHDIKWESQAHYHGQLVLGNNVLYAMEGKQQLTAMAADTGKILWKTNIVTVDQLYNVPVATTSILFIPASKNTYAISLVTHQIVWSIPVSGKLVLGNATLFIIGKDNIVTAVALK